MKIFTYVLSIILLATILIDVPAQIGGTLEVERSVVAGGGNVSSSSVQFIVEGTIGQKAAGVNGSGGTFSMFNGFWTPEPLAPTAAHVTVSGRVFMSPGNRLSRTYASLMDPANGSEETVVVGIKGYFTFEDVEVGRFYIISIRRSGFIFQPAVIGINVVDTVDDLVFSGAIQRKAGN